MSRPDFSVGDVVRVRVGEGEPDLGLVDGQHVRIRHAVPAWVGIETLSGVEIERFPGNTGGDTEPWRSDRFELIASAQTTPTEGPTTVNPTTSPTFKPGDRVKRIGGPTSLSLLGAGAVPIGAEVTVRSIALNGNLYFEGFGYNARPGYFELVDTRPSYEKLGIAPGDLVKATKGESVRQDRAFEVSSGRLFLIGSALENLERRGFTFEIVEKALPPLPTEDGFYVEADPAAPSFRAFTANVYELDGGDWHIRPWEPAMRTTSIDAPEHLRGKLVRLVAAEVAA